MTMPLTAQAPLAPLYHPTSVVLVDDNPDVLTALTAALEGVIQCIAFRSVQEAIVHVRAHGRRQRISLSAIPVVLPGTLEHIRDPGERAQHLAASLLPRVFADAGRFACTSVIVLGESLAQPPALHDLHELPLRKLLLTERDLGGVAAQALRAGLVDAVQDASAPTPVLANRLHQLQLEFFRDLTSPIEPALARADTRFLLDPFVQSAFATFAATHTIIEHSACMHPPGLLGLDKAGNSALMLIVDEDYRQASFEIAHAEAAPTELLRRLARSDTVAAFPTASGFYAAGLATDWRKCLWEACKLGDNGWVSAIVEAPDIARIVCGSIASYDSYRRRRLH